MREYEHQLQPMDADYFCCASPGALARIIIGDTVLQIERDGVERSRLLAEKRGAWMVDKFRLEQFVSLGYAARFTVRLSPRREKGVRIYYTAEVRSDGACAARAEISFFAVEFFQRRVLRLGELEEMWTTPAEQGKPMSKAAWRGEMTPCGAETVRFSDCDSNQHLSSPKYLDLICDATGYWTGEQKICALMQVDFVSECRPGETLQFSTAEADGVTYIRGAHSTGERAFDAMCKYSLPPC